MKKKILPVIVTTVEALRAVADRDVPVIYVENVLYSGQAGAIRSLLADRGYVLSATRGRRGVFFLQSSGEHAFRHELHEISDPMNIL